VRKKRKNKGDEKMKSTQQVSTEQMVAAQPPKVAGHLFGVRSPRNPVTEMPAGSLSLEMSSNYSLTEPDKQSSLKPPIAAKKCAGLW
jgi:hypothetical protein